MAVEDRKGKRLDFVAYPMIVERETRQGPVDSMYESEVGCLMHGAVAGFAVGVVEIVLDPGIEKRPLGQ
jgi:hypothetical protein